MVLCPECGKLHEEEVLFCSECGADLQKPVSEEMYTEETEVPKKKKKAWPWILAASLCFVALAVVAVWFFFGRQTKMKNYGLFIKEGNVFYTDCSPKGTWDSGIFSGFDSDGEYADPYYAAMNNATNAAISKDGKILFLPEKEDLDTPMSLYYRRTDDKSGKAVEIGDDIYSYAISDDGMSVYCFTGRYRGEPDAELYYYDLKTGDTQDIADNVLEFLLSADGKRVVYAVYDESEEETVFCLWEKDKGEKELYATDGNYVIFCTADLSTLYGQLYSYIGDQFESTIYRYDLKSHTREKIASNASVDMIYESGAIYYTSHDENTLFYYDGEKSVDVTEKVNNISCQSYCDPILVVRSTERLEIDGIIIEDRFNEIDPIAGTSYIAPDGSAVYIFEYETCTLYKFPISGKRIGEREKVDSEICELSTMEHTYWYAQSCMVFFLPDSSMVYAKDYDRAKRTVSLYRDGEKLVADVYIYGAHCPDGIIMFYTDYDWEADSGTLNVYRDGKQTQVAEDVCDYIMTPEKDILYLTEYDRASYEGTLYFYDWETGKAEVNAEDVSAIAYVYPGRIRGNLFSNNMQYIDFMQQINHNRIRYGHWDYYYYSRYGVWDTFDFPYQD